MNDQHTWAQVSVKHREIVDRMSFSGGANPVIALLKKLFRTLHEPLRDLPLLIERKRNSEPIMGYNTL